jgi:hypothetical protein
MASLAWQQGCRSSLVRVLAAAAALSWGGAALAQEIEFQASDSDGSCPSGYVLATAGDARMNQQAACQVLGTWYIARLAGGGSMDGPGYDCKIRDEDTRSLGNSLCRRGPAQQTDVSACIDDTLTGQVEGAVVSWTANGQVVAQRPDITSLPDGLKNMGFANEAAINYCRGKGFNWSSPRIEEHMDVHLDVQCCTRLSTGDSSVPPEVLGLVDAAIQYPESVANIAEGQNLDDVYAFAQELGIPLSRQTLETQVATAPPPRASMSKRSVSCGGLGQPGCAECTNKVTVYFPFNFCCIPEYSTCLDTTPITHCEPGLAPSAPNGLCDIDRRAWKDKGIDLTRMESDCGPSFRTSCWQKDDERRDQLQLDTSQLNDVTVLGPGTTTLPSGTRFIYVYRKQDNRIVIRNYDRGTGQNLYSGNCRQSSPFGSGPCTMPNSSQGTYLHVRHTQLNHAPGTAAENNWDPVWCAGEMRIENGNVCLINNESGHFKPPAACTAYVAQTLKTWRVPTATWLLTGNFSDYKAGKDCTSQRRDEL